LKAYDKPRPIVSPIDKPYWEFLRKHELRLQRCGDCSAFRFPASPVCAECGSARYSWERSTGKGEVFSWVVFHKSYFPSFAANIPYNVTMVRLDDGPMFIANIVGIDNAAIKRGMPVEIVFDDVAEDLTIPRFKIR
jgi:uncharacterized protein